MKKKTPTAMPRKPSGFPCPHDDCNGTTAVKRTTRNGRTIRRVRACAKCKKRFVTVEAIPAAGINSADLRISIETLISQLKNNPLTSPIVRQFLQEHKA